MIKPKLIVKFSEVDKNDIALVGGKGANLGEMAKAHFPVPDGYIVTAEAYYDFLKANNLTSTIKNLIKTIDVDRPTELDHVSQKVKKLIVESAVPENLAKLIATYYTDLGGVLVDSLVAVRSSATAEDLPTASFAGQQETYLNVKGESNVVLKVRDCWASLFSSRAIFYRAKNNFDHFRVGIACVIQKMVQSEASGIMFTIDPVSNDKSKIVVESILGLGELIVGGSVTPDHYEVNKHSWQIDKKIIGIQESILKKVGTKNKIEKLSTRLSEHAKITDQKVIEIAKIGDKIEKHYYFPQDIEWAIEKNKVFIVQSRPVTTVESTTNLASQAEKTEVLLEKNLKEVLRGQPASPGIGTGPAKVIFSAKELHKIVPGDILVTTMTNPDYVPGMKKASAIVTDEGGRTAHAAIVSRELGIPAIVGSLKATKVLKNGRVYTVDGIKGVVYEGSYLKKLEELHLLPAKDLTKHAPIVNNQVKTATKIYVNLAEPEKAGEIAKLNVDGVGLLRAEFMIAQIGKHPKAFIHEKKQAEFVDKLSDGLKTFAQAFQPRPVVYRATDFRTNEYRNLIGGKAYEPEEPNPMLGYRGCFRYIHDPEVFRLEIEAIKRVRNKFGFKNLWLMIPFVRTVKELIEVKSLLSSFGLTRSASFKLWMMVEIPSNVILLDKFIEVGLDGISIGSNDLTMLVLGTDRDNSEVASEYDERNEAVLWALERIVKTCHKYKITSSICGQAPSDYPDITEKLVSWGVTSVSINPDVIDHTRSIVAMCEERVIRNGKAKV
ncbi:phosphoenolpyruvate synthase [Candidatus Gottesmanbacteria bacterium]|nr:phosphoenolpyruvate synthase [Candidatus Gottesmanbacteria bacterium]